MVINDACKMIGWEAIRFDEYLIVNHLMTESHSAHNAVINRAGARRNLYIIITTEEAQEKNYLVEFQWTYAYARALNSLVLPSASQYISHGWAHIACVSH